MRITLLFLLASALSALPPAQAVPLKTTPKSTTLVKRDATIAGSTFDSVATYYQDGEIPITLGIRYEQNYEFGERCWFADYIGTVDRIVTVGDNEYTEKGHQLKIHCTKSVKHIAWDVKRVGEPWDCGKMTVKKSFTVSQETQEALNTKVDTGYSQAGFSLAVGLEYNKSFKDTKSETGSIECKPSNNEMTCTIGAPALVEAVVWEGYGVLPYDGDPVSWEGWKYLIDSYPKYSTPGPNLPWVRQSWGLDYNGLEDVSEVNMYSYDLKNHPNGMDMWTTTGEENCVNLFGNRNWGADYKDM